MSNVIVKDGASVDKYFKTTGVGTDLDPFLSIPADFYLEVRKGNVEKHSIIQKFGAIQDVTTTLTPVTSSGTYPTPTTPIALELVSDSVDDASGGTGAISVTLEGVSNTNGSWTREVQSVTLTGTTPVAVPNSMTRVDRLYVSESGSYANGTTPSHSSTITLRVAGAGATWQNIISESGFGLSQSEISVYTIPKGFSGYILSKNVSIEATRTANVFLFTREGADVVSAPFTPMRVKELERNLSTNASRKPNSPLLKITGPADVGFMAQSTSVTTSLSIEFEVLLVED
jgi:hypothetical protein